MGASPLEDAARRPAAALLARRDAASCVSTGLYRRCLQRLLVARDAAARLSKPVAPIRDPPTHINQSDGRRQRPPERQNKIRRQPEHGEADPEDLRSIRAFYPPAFLSRGKRIKRCHEALVKARSSRGRGIRAGPRAWRRSGAGDGHLKHRVGVAGRFGFRRRRKESSPGA